MIVGIIKTKERSRTKIHKQAMPLYAVELGEIHFNATNVGNDMILLIILLP